MIKKLVVYIDIFDCKKKEKKTNKQKLYYRRQLNTYICKIYKITQINKKKN